MATREVSEFVSYLSEVFARFGPIEAKRMFGGYGIYHHGLMFALVGRDVLYLKSDAASAPEFERLGSSAFEYHKDGKVLKMGYHAAPAHLFEDVDEAKRWAERAYQIALRARAEKERRPRRPSAAKRR